MKEAYTLSKLLVRIVLGGGLLLVGMFIGVIGGRLPVFASMNLFQDVTPPVSNGDYCLLYETTLANDLHVSTSALEQANVDALQKTINQLAKDGKITTSEQLALEAGLMQAGRDPCKNLPAVASSLMSNPALKQQLAAIHTKLVNDVAPSLKLLPSTLNLELSAGKPIVQIAEEQQVPLSDVNTAYLKSVKAILAQHVKSQDITQDQADWLYSVDVQAVNNGHYPLLDLK